MIFPKVHFRYGSLLCEIETWNPPPSHAFFLLYPFNTDVNVIIWNTLISSEWHHMMFWWCYALFGGNPCACTWHAEQKPCSEHGCHSRHTHPPFMQSEMVTPGAYHDTCIQCDNESGNIFISLVINTYVLITDGRISFIYICVLLTFYSMQPYWLDSPCQYVVYVL